MCTIGIRRFGDEDYILFKNKDFGRRVYEDRIVVDEDLFGVVGLSTFAEADSSQDLLSGISVGANSAGLLCCDSNVRGSHDQSNYDELVEIALRTGKGVEAAVAAIRTAVSERPYLWGNLIMIDGTASAAIEVRDQTVAVTSLSDPAVRSNHHLKLSAPGGGDTTGSTKNRLAAGQRRVESATALEDVFALQSAHDDGATGICSHEGNQTVYAYVLRRHAGRTSLYVTRGHPCEGRTRVELAVPIGAAWSPQEAAAFRATYPSKWVSVEG